MYKMGLKVFYVAILVKFQPPNPLNSPLYYQWSTSKGSYSPKSLHKLVLQESVSNSVFSNYKCTNIV